MSRSEAQSCLDKQIEINLSTPTIHEVFDAFSQSTGLSFSYSNDILDIDVRIAIRPGLINIDSYLDQIQKTQNILYQCSGTNKVLLYRSDTTDELIQKRRYYGTIYDQDSGEKLYGAYILSDQDVALAISDSKGFYSIRTDAPYIKIQYLGYAIENVALKQQAQRRDIGMSKNNQLNTLILNSNILRDITDIEGDHGVVSFQNKGYAVGFLGDENGLNLLRQKPGVQSGAEGQTGLIIRGGTEDENLYLYNGVPLYEMSHTAGLSSILQSENIQNIELYKNGMPARYGGRLSSIVQIKTKNGNKYIHEGSISANLSAISTHLEGPISKERISYNINLRQSILNLYIDPLVRGVIDYDDVGISYQDLSGNVHFQLTDNSELNVFGYHGEDAVHIIEDQNISDNGDFYGFINDNEIRWGTDLVGIQYQQIVSNDLVLKCLLSSSEYEITTKARFISDRVVDGSFNTSQLNVVSSSAIQDRKFSLLLDYYLLQFDKLSFGVEWLDHEYAPAIVQSSRLGSFSFLEIFGNIDLIDAWEWASFIEYKNYRHSLLKLNAGLRYSRFTNEDTVYDQWEPRLSIQSDWSQHIKTRLHYSKTAQYLHLLSNGSGGFPADLWVPATANIRPKIGTQWSASVEVANKILDFLSISIFRKNTEGILDYQGSQDVLFSIVNDENPPIIFKNNTDWETRVISGSTTVHGWEISLSKSLGNWKVEGAYSRMIASNVFVDIDDGVSFRSRQDRPHDVNISLIWQPKASWLFNLNFVYGSGSPYSLDIEQVKTIQCDIVTVSGPRNRLRLPSFHHLDLGVKYSKKLTKGTLDFQFGIYNIYNRLNPFYVYVFRDPLTQRNRLRQISLFPIMPSCGIQYLFEKK